ncbi:MAG: hypothetical protein H0W11_01710 [Gemmatimonadetes bacterium]|jgi:uncharacterized protein (DUF1778 family)|nr:hypothetical protein [Gemmatimonadota bacterium]MBA4159256.1 hypothetical protein [Gemmatimonadota bacterium]
MAIPHKTERITFRVTPAQRVLLQARAEREGRWLSEWLRELVARAVSEELPPGYASQRTV